MASDGHNALAELAERLKPIGNTHHTFLIDYADIDKAQRIIAELAKVQFVKTSFSDEVHWPIQGHAFDALVACRAIAEEVDGK